MFKRDSYVQHPGMPAWGIGKVLEDVVADKVRVFFIDAGEKLISLKNITLQQVDPPKVFHPVLDNPAIYSRDKSKKFVSLPQAKAQFLVLFPEGFNDKEYFREERDYKVVAHDLMQSQLGKNQYAELLSKVDYTEICRKRLPSLPTVFVTAVHFPEKEPINNMSSLPIRAYRTAQVRS